MTGKRNAPRRPPGRPRSREAHAAILSAAIALTRERGFDALSIEGIAARAGVGKATVYRRWASKEALISEALERMLRGFPIPDTGSVRGDLLAVMKQQRGLYADPATAELLSGLLAATVRSERISKAVRHGFVAAREEAIRTVLRRAVRRGELRPRLDLELALDLFSGPLFYRFLVTGRPIDERLGRKVVEALLRTLSR